MRVEIPLIIFISLWMPVLGWSQDCDCLDSDNCPLAIEANTTGQVCYDITDALNNNLADPNQGICGVRLTFTHRHIWDLELSLVSPSGQVVPLVGPNTNAFGTTNNVLWDVLFIPCSGNAQPDTINGNPLSEVWDNDQNWPFAAVLTGTYFPTGNNCLEAFNSGPVNGSWCLQIDNQPSTYTGEIINFEVLLCDNSGLLCCDAEGGNLPGPDDLTLCEGNADLMLDFDVNYGPLPPDTLEYGYTWLISDTDGLLLEIDTLPDLTAYLPGSYQVCGLSYLLADSLALPVVDGALTLADVLADIDGPNPSFCGDLSSDCKTIEIVPPPNPVELVATICEGEEYDLAGTLLTVTGSYSVTLQTAAQCDSVVNLELTVFPVDTVFLTEVICEGETFAVGDSLYDGTGQYSTLLTSSFGCDSLVELDLQVLAPIDVFLVDTICAGQSFAVGDSLFSSSGNYVVPLLSSQNCDSLVHLDLTVLTLQAGIVPPELLTCSDPVVTLDGTASSNEPGISYSWSSPDGQLQGPLDGLVAEAIASGLYILTVEQAGCQVADSVQVVADTLPPVSNAGLPDTLTCFSDSLQLDGTASTSGAGISYQWLSSNGNLLSGADTPTPYVDQAGTYFLIVTDSGNGCRDTSAVAIAENTTAPPVEAGPGQLITCLADTAWLDGSDTYAGSLYQYEWTDGGGQTIAWQDSLQAPVTEAGWYFLLATDPLNGCSAVDSVEVTTDTLPPLAEAGLPDTLTCIVLQVGLSGAGSSAGPQYTYLWTTSGGGNILDPPDQLNISVDAPGAYLLTVTDADNGCTAIDSVQIAENTELPLVEAGPTVTLNCVLVEWDVGDPNATSQGPEYSYLWLDGSFSPIAFTPTTPVDQPDTYQLIVTNNLTGCLATDQVTILADQDMPAADPGQGGTLTCDNPTLALDGGNSTMGPFISYTWYASDGSVVGEDPLLTVGLPDTYCLVVENGENLCADTACVVVDQDASLPTVDPGPDQFLDCQSGEALLDGSNSSTGADINYLWTTTDGNILVDPSLPVITVDQAGWYTLTVHDIANDCLLADSVQVFLDTAACTPQVNAGADGLINCYNFPSVTLDATAGTSAGPNFTFFWSTDDGAIVNGEDSLTPEVTEGTYVLTVVNTAVGLSATDTVVVTAELDPPFADAGPDAILDCATIGNNFQLDGTASSQGPQFAYEWSTDGGNIVQGENTLTPLVNLPGIYDLLVTNTDNGCSATSGVLIVQDGDAPPTCLPDAVQIPCGDTLILTGDTCATFTYQWSVDGGLIWGADNEALVSVQATDSVAVASVVVTNPQNLCVTVDSVLVFAPTSCFPDCHIQTPDTLTCAVDQVELDGAGSSEGPEFTYFWEAITGSLCGVQDQLQACAAAAGTYRLTVTDTMTNFTCSIEVEVEENVVLPLVDAGTAGPITCMLESVLLDGTGSVLGPQYSYLWTGPQAGCILNGETGLLPEVGCPGDYTLAVTDQTNGCTGADLVTVGVDTLPPNAVLAPPLPLTCSDGTSTLNGAGSTTGVNILYIWRWEGNIMASGPTATTYIADQPGLYCLEVLDIANGCSDSTCVVLLQDNSLPQADAGPDQSITCVDTLLTLTGSGSAGPNYTYLWTGPPGCILGDPTQAQIQVNCPGQYQFSVTDLLTNCTGSDLLEVIDDRQPPFADAGPDLTITCLQPTALLNGTNSTQGPDFGFQWSAMPGHILNGADTPTPVVDSAGTYQLIVTDQSNGCSDTSLMTVVLDADFPTADAGPDATLTCTLTQLQLNGTGSMQGGGIGYLWTALTPGNIVAGAQTLFPTVDQPGVYQLMVTDSLNGCTSIDSVLVGLDQAPPQLQITPAAPVLNCLQEQISLSAAGSTPAGALSFSWSTADGHFLGGTTGMTAIVDSAGTYQLLVIRLDNGCQDSTEVTVGADFVPPILVIDPPPLLTCADTSVQIDATASIGQGPVDVVWTGPPGQTVPIGDPNTLLPTVVEPLTYFVTITNQGNGCSAEGSVTVSEDTQPPTAQAVALGQLDCTQTQVELSGAGSSSGPEYQYQWTGPLGAQIDFDTSLFPQVDLAGPYQLQVTDLSNGCRDTAEVIVMASAIPIDLVQYSVTGPTCFDDKDARIVIDSVIGGEGPYVFSLNGGAFAPWTQYNYLPPGVYTLTAQDSNGCEWETSFTIEAPMEVLVDLGPDTTIQLGQTVTLEAQLSIPPAELDTIIWTPLPDPACPECLQQLVGPLYQSTYYVEVVDLNGCKNSDRITVFVEKSQPLYVPNIFSPNGDGENDRFFFQAGLEVVRIDELAIFDRWGNKVFVGKDLAPNDPGLGWDGTFQQKPLDPQVFVWLATVSFVDGTREVYQGDLVLVR